MRIATFVEFGVDVDPNGAEIATVDVTLNRFPNAAPRKLLISPTKRFLVQARF